MKRRILSCALVASLAACAGGGNGPATPPGPSQAQTHPVNVSLVIPLSRSGSAQPHFVSPSTQSASISVSGAHGASVSDVVDLSSASGSCHTTGGQRTCNTSLMVPLDTDTFSITLYDKAPAGGSIPSGAHILGSGSVTQDITLSYVGPLTIYVGGQVSGIGLSSTYASASANGTAQNIGITIAPTDFGNNPIVAGANDPYANPITATLTETGGSGHMHLVLNGSASGASATLTQSSDTISVAYDGGGSAGYSASVTLSASGATSQTFQVSPLFVTSTSPYYASSTLSLNGSVSSISMIAQEANAPATVAYTVTPSGCTNIASASGVTTTAGIGVFSVTGGSTASPSGTCTFSVSDGTSSIVLGVINTPAGGNVPLPGWSIQEFQALPTPGSSPPASPGAIAPGPDGRMWFAADLATGVGAITTTGSVTPYTGTLDTYNALVAGPDGNMWGTDYYTHSIDKFSTSGAMLSYYSTNFTPYGITVGPDGNVWYTDSSGGTGEVSSITPNGAMQHYMVMTPASPNPGAITSAPDGTLWFCASSSQIDSVTTSGAITAVFTLVPGSGCGSLVTGYDGNVWVTGNSTGVLVINPTSKALVATVPLTNRTASPSYIATGPDHAMYVTDGNVIDRITLSPTVVTPYAVPTTSANLWGIALGADGRLWFAENNVNQIGALSP